MSFTEQSDGSGTANYLITIIPPLPIEHLALVGKLGSGYATGEITPADAEQIASDLKAALTPLGYTFYFNRYRSAEDEWIPA
jgi:hypothetical protein